MRRKGITDYLKRIPVDGKPIEILVRDRREANSICATAYRLNSLERESHKREFVCRTKSDTILEVTANPL